MSFLRGGSGKTSKPAMWIQRVNFLVAIVVVAVLNIVVLLKITKNGPTTQLITLQIPGLVVLLFSIGALLYLLRKQRSIVNEEHANDEAS